MAKTAIKARADKFRSRAGYTLAELLVVLAIIGLTSAVLAPRLVGVNREASTKAAATQLMNLCRKARQAAQTTGISQQIVIDTETRSAWLATTSNKIFFGKKIDLETKTAEPESVPDLAGIRFFPDGSSTGGEVRFLAEHSSYVLNVIWANGEIRVNQIP